MIDLKEACALLGVSPFFVRAIIEVGEVTPSVTVPGDGQIWDEGTDFLFSEADIDRFRTDISKRRFVELRERHAYNILPDAEFRFGPGWSHLIRQASAAAVGFDPAWAVKIRHGKEKLGCLILSFDYEGDEPRTPVFRLEESIRKKSLTICEECGQPGRLRMGHMICKTTCDRHAHLIGEPRDDDGIVLDCWE